MASPTETSLRNSTLRDSTSSVIHYTEGLAGVNQVANNLYIQILFYSLIGFGVCVVLLRWARLANMHLRKVVAVTAGPEQQKFWTYNHTRLWPLIKKHVLFAPLFTNRHSREFRISPRIDMGTLPTRFQAVLIVLYTLSNIIYCVILDFKGKGRAERLAELRGRTGVLAVYNLIPTILFAMRNNPLIPLLHVSYDTFNLFHRWMARIVIVEAAAHTIAWAINNLYAGGYQHLRHSLDTSTSYQWGMVGTVMFGVIFFQASSPARHAFYETFLNVHKLLAVCAFIGVYVHLDKAKLPQLPYLWIIFIVWGLEYFFRLLRIFWYNFSRKHGFTHVTVEALPAEACRVTFHLTRPWKFHPGCHVHAYLPRLSLWSSHPFSVAWANSVAIPSLGDISTNKELATPSTLEFASKELPLDKQNTSGSRTDVSLVMRCRDGMTRSLYLRAAATPSQTLSLTGWLEGPYGGHLSLDSYGTVMLFAGGVGITHQVGFIKHLLAGHTARTVAARKIILVWSIQTLESLEWIRPWMDEILQMPDRREILKVLIFVTRPRSPAEVVSPSGAVRLFPGRCNPLTLLDAEIPGRIGAMAVTVCGPGPFGDSVRAAARARVGVGCVDFVEEAFTY